MKRTTIVVLISLITLASCEFLDPYPIVDLDDETLWSNAEWGEGILTEAYTNLNTNWDFNLEYYTDNAVPSSAGSNILALGGWTVENNPIGDWSEWYNTIKYLNYYIQEGEDLVFSVSDSVRNATLQDNRIGEAYYLRAWYQWQLLQTYGGMVNGQAMGFPIVTEFLETDDELDLPRNTYEECVAQIVDDLNEAISILPFDYSNGNDSYTGLVNRGRGSASAAMALKAKVYLYAASPAFGNSSNANWMRAAETAYNAIDSMGGLSNLSPYGNFNEGSNFDYIWISPGYYSNNWLERAFYPPSLYGNGQSNPSQNLVDAFPAADGYPVDVSTGYDETNPYVNRDPRFNRFIFFNGNNYDGTFIRTYEGGADAPGGLSQQGTRTGYYLKKHLSNNVRLTPGDVTSDITFKVYLSKTDLYLSFAEAANEAYGPTDATPGFSAVDVMRVIRQRAGIDSDPGTPGYQDQYLDDQAAAGQAAFRDFIRNERRIELCFEESRFWDIRRWNLDLAHTIRGVEITESASPLAVDPSNIALEATPSTDYVSPWERLNAVNNGSTSTSDGKYGNWYSGGMWRYIQYDNFPEYMLLSGASNVYEIDRSEIYYWQDGGGILYPDSVYIEVWDMDLNEWVEIWSDYDGVEGNQFNTATFTPVISNSIRINFKSNTQSCGVVEWQVWGEPVDPAAFDYEYVNVENHTFQDYMRYVPLPYSQTLIMSNLDQNTGW